MRWSALIFSLLALVACLAQADSVSKLLEEFTRRDQIKLTPDQGNAFNFLKAVNYNSANVAEIDILSPTTFVFRDRNGDLCFADNDNAILHCKNPIGVTSTTTQEKVQCLCLAADASTSKLLAEFNRLDQLKMTPEQEGVINFLKGLNYKISEVMEVDILTPTTFVFRDRGGDICFGDNEKLILRCKNPIGVTGVSYQGDSD